VFSCMFNTLVRNCCSYCTYRYFIFSDIFQTLHYGSVHLTAGEIVRLQNYLEECTKNNFFSLTGVENYQLKVSEHQ
jgi:hypothetical protein